MRIGLLLTRMGHFAHHPSSPRLEVLFVWIVVVSSRPLRLTRGGILAEMRAIVDELHLVWSLGTRRIKVQSDTTTTLAILAKHSSLNHQ
ncbi:hypothetical protein LINGRAHAP2_LOCUS31455 [Linum grandiflorum]